jgi:hypothetical protein
VVRTPADIVRHHPYFHLVKCLKNVAVKLWTFSVRRQTAGVRHLIWFVFHKRRILSRPRATVTLLPDMKRDGWNESSGIPNRARDDFFHVTNIQTGFARKLFQETKNISGIKHREESS